MNKYILVLIIAIVLIVYKPWFVNNEIIASDFPYFYKEFISENSLVPPAWSAFHGNGLGGKILVYSLDSYMFLTQSIARLSGIEWSYIYKIFWYFAYLILGILSSYKLSRYVLKSDKLLGAISSLIYVTNNYILMVVSGGQMGIALAYSIFPFGLLYFLKSLEGKKIEFNNILKHSIFLALILLFDIRIFYVYLIALFISSLIFLYSNFNKIYLRKLFLALGLSIIIGVLLNSFWILPFILNPIDSTETTGKGYSTVESLKFFSFANLPNTISLLHPNWPENIFGKVGFQKAAYLLLPILAFSSLLFIAKNKFILVFVIFGLIGAFLAKGSNEPFGEIYIYLYQNIPGFFMFRDSTKFYILISVSFTILIPLFFSFFTKKITNFILILFLVLWCFLIRESLVGEISGSFSKISVPDDYQNFREHLIADKNFSRTLWVPRLYKFTFTTLNHPTVEAEPLFNATNSATILAEFHKPNAKEQLKRYSIGYVVIPYDSLENMFLEDRKYSSKLREELEKELDKITYMEKIYDNKLTVYKTDILTTQFTFNNNSIPSVQKSSTSYLIENKYLGDGKLFFSQKYNKNWRLFLGEREIMPIRTYDNLIEFELRNVNEDAKIIFVEQRNFNIGWGLSTFILIIVIILLLKNPYSKSKTSRK